MKKAFDLMGDAIVELSKENETLKIQIDEYDEKWLAKTKANIWKHNDDEKRAILILSGM